MQQFEFPGPAQLIRNRVKVLAAGLLAASTLATSASVANAAFLQTTELKGHLGADIGGVWLAVHNMMPEFRIRYDRPEGASSPSDYAPFKVGPLSDELVKAFGKSLEGVMVTEISDQKFANEHGIFVGDIVLRFNQVAVTSPAEFQEGLEEAPKSIILTMRRRALMHSAARLLKVRYEVTEGREIDPTGAEVAVANERVNLIIFDVALPFDEEIEKARQEKALWSPTPEDLKKLSETWADLPEPKFRRYLRGTHEIVAAANYDSNLALDRNLFGTSMAMIMKLDGLGAGGQGAAGQLIDVYGLRSVAPDRMAGSVVSALVASAPFPISVEFKGAVTFYKVADYSDLDTQKGGGAGKAPGEGGDEFEGVELEPDVPANLGD